MKGEVFSLNVSRAKGTKKKPVDEVNVIAGLGIEDDAHAGQWHRQVSLLAVEGINAMGEKGVNVGAGDFAENITTEGIDLSGLSIGSRLRLGSSVELRVSQIGKVCHLRCAIFEQAGYCIMPEEGVFAEVLAGGALRKGDSISIL